MAMATGTDLAVADAAGQASHVLTFDYLSRRIRDKSLSFSLADLGRIMILSWSAIGGELSTLGRARNDRV